MEDISEVPLIIEAEVEGYLVRRVASVEVTFKHCFENPSPTIKVRLNETQIDLVGFIGEVIKPLGNIKLEVCFRSKGLCKITSMKFTIIKAPSPYNIILGRSCLKVLRAILSTIRSMIEFSTPKGIATLKEEGDMREVTMTEVVLVNPAFTDQLVIIGGGLSEESERSLPFFNTLKNITKENKDEYKWIEEAEEAFQKMKKLIMDLPLLTMPLPKETLRMLNEDERNYAPLEKLALSLLHMSRRLKRKRISHQKTENKAKNDKTRHGMEKL
ncbi:hypothetical protein Tco_1190118 [Tanacetum coccineum]